MPTKRREIYTVSDNLSRPEKSIVFDNLNGGLNLWELDYRMEPNESPAMQNLFWQDGVLSCRDGQDWVFDDAALGTGYAMYSGLFEGYAVWHAGTKLYCANVRQMSPVLREICGGVPAIRGTFFRYRDALYYKTKGAYLCISWSGLEPSYTAAFTAGSGQTVFTVSTEGHAAHFLRMDSVSVDGTVLAETDYSVSVSGLFLTVTLSTAPDAGSTVLLQYSVETLSAAPVAAYTPVTLINADPVTAAGDLYQPENRLTGQKTIWYNAASGVAVYALPEKDIASVDRVTVDGETLSASDYTVNTIAGTVTFNTAPPVTTPATNNTVVITYTKSDSNAAALYNSIMDCRYAAVYGAEVDLCIVLAGCDAQPNAYFWNGNNIAMDPGYWPAAQYNLAGNAADAITGFGKQQNQLIIFSEGSVGKVELGTADLDGRTALSMDYTAINDKIGCDLPWTIQLVENNLVFCNTEGGVHTILSTSAAYENNIRKISRNIDGTPLRPGLLAQVRRTPADLVCSVDDGNRYWLVANGDAYVWDYELSPETKPSWFYFTNIPAVSFATNQAKLWHIDARGRLSKFGRIFMDYGGAIDKRFRFAYQHFGTYDRLKDVTTVLFMIRSDVSTNMRVQYLYDYGSRYDATNLVTHSFSLVPRDLRFRDLSVSNLAAVFRRRPGLRHVHHFAMELTNNTPGEDMSIVSAQVFFRYQGRER